MDPSDSAKYRKEGREKGIVSPYRLALYVTARGMGKTPDKALEAAKVCDPKVVKKFESDK